MNRASTTPERRFLIIGCGSIGKRHLGNLLAAGAGEAIAFDIRADRAEEVRSRFGIEVLTDLDAALDRRPQVAFVTAPSSLHVPLAVRAAERGCHLFIEKPLSHTRDGVDRLQELVRRNDLVTLVGCNLRFHPGLVAVKRLLEQGAIGRVVATRIEVGQYLPDWHPDEDYRRGYSARQDLGGGVILDAIHEVDYIRWLLGPVRSVACFAGTLSRLEVETEDTAAVLLRFAGGAIGEVHLDYVQRVYSRTCHVIGDEGTIRWDYTSGEASVYRATSRAWESFPNPDGWQPNQMYVDELNHFLRCLAGAERPVLDVDDAARVLDVALAAKASSESGRVLHFEVAL
jgi:predicted dehydrogenase